MTSLKESRTSNHEIIECLPYFKKHAMKSYVKEESADPYRDKVKAKQKNDLVKTSMSISISIGSHIYHPWRLPRICPMQWKTYTKMTLRTQLKNVKVQCQKTFNDYFTRRSHLKEQLEVVENNVKEAKA